MAGPEEVLGAASECVLRGRICSMAWGLCNMLSLSLSISAGTVTGGPALHQYHAVDTYSEGGDVD